ncbi:AzlC family ABC transporter permease [Desulfoscipio geothermicus]|uniref:Predicted branched-chain amino acid permease (Azaleucine resistance) n=1 Tax=Desulfoscipio geothermicus DSM 3669 TaxID=1121426 RepID=A0A1I6D1K5_9FIRM|nr:AzlC family ABC transporter permease [Desulfoscipio geothermicus]SFQ99261.1 Predicted branched-chain amino acid permease (azaleucine resistance) [Desulfoscipio geothermicus DSM 3669]
MRDGTREFIQGFVATFIFAFELLPLGLLFGTMSADAGLSTWAAVGMSTIVFAGASQFLAITMLGAGASATTIVLGTFFINLRHFLMSSYVAGLIPGRRLASYLPVGLLITDESFALISQRLGKGQRASYQYIVGANLSVYVQWFIATLAGLLLGSALPGLADLGMQAALYSLFAAILVLSVSSYPEFWAAVLAGTLAVAFTMGGYRNTAILLASLIASVTVLGVQKWTQKSG